MKKFMVMAIFAMFFASVPMAMAQDNGGMMNTPSELPTITPAGQSSNFAADSLSDAQNICDQVASQNNQTKCSAIRNEANPTNVQTYHCNCIK